MLIISVLSLLTTSYGALLGEECDIGSYQCPDEIGYFHSGQGSRCTDNGDGVGRCLTTFCIPFGAFYSYQGYQIGECCAGSFADPNTETCEPDTERGSPVGAKCITSNQCANGLECRGYGPKVCKIVKRNEYGDRMCLPTGYLNWSLYSRHVNKAIGDCCKPRRLDEFKLCQ